MSRALSLAVPVVSGTRLQSESERPQEGVVVS